MRHLLCVSLLLLAATVVEVHSDVTSDCAGKPTDVVFVLDASNSIWQPDFRRQLNFIKDVVAFFTVGPRNMMVSVVTYAAYPRLQFLLNSYNRKSDLFAAIDNIHQDGGYETKTSAALRYVRERAFSETFGARPRLAQRVAVIVTDGRSDNTTLTVLEAAKVKADGVHLFAVGVGRYLDMEELRLLASDPNDYYTFLVDNYSGLGRIKDLLAIKTCAVTDPPSTTTTTTTTTTPSTTTITTTTTAIRQRRVKTTARNPTTPTTSESKTALSATNRNNNNDDENDDDDNKIKSGENPTDHDGSELTDDKDVGAPKSVIDRDSHLTGNENLIHFGGSPVTVGPKNVNPSDRITGNNLDRRSDGNKTAGGGGGGIAGSESSESGKGSAEDENPGRESGKGNGTGSEDPRSGGNTSEESGGGKGDPNQRKIRYEPPRPLDILSPPMFVPGPTQYPYHELKGNNLTYVHPWTTSEHDGVEEGERTTKRRPGHSSNRPTDQVDGENPSRPVTGIGVYYFDDNGRFVRINGSESMVDVDQLPKVTEDEHMFTEGGLILSQDTTTGRRRIVGCEVNGSHYIGQWVADDRRKLFHGYRAPPEIADRLGNGPRHVIDSAEHRIVDNSTGDDDDDDDDGKRPRKDGDDVTGGNDVTGIGGNVAGHGESLPDRRRDGTDPSNPSGTGYDGIQVLDPNGKSGYWDEDKDGRNVWYLYTCPGIYVPAPDGPPVDENGEPRLNGQSQCTEQDENGQDVDYIYNHSNGQFERFPFGSSSGVVPGGNKDPGDDDGKYKELKGRPEERVEDDTNDGSSQSGLDSVEINGEDRTGVWIEVGGSLKRIANELVDLKLPQIDEDQDFYVSANIIWTKGGGGELKPVGCIINGTYYVGYWIRRDDGTRLLYGYPSETLGQKLTQRPPKELTHRLLRERPPTTVEHDGDGRWVVDERGELHWLVHVPDDDTTSSKNLELKMVERNKTGETGGEEDRDRTPGQDAVEYTTPPEKEVTGRQVVVLDSNGQTGTYRREHGKFVWYRYVCPGVYEPVPEGLPTSSSSSTEDRRSDECTMIDEETGALFKYVYKGPGRFVKVRTEPSAGGDRDDDRDGTTKHPTGDSKGKREEENNREGEDNKTKRQSTDVPGLVFLHRRATLTPFYFETEDDTRPAWPKPGSIHKPKDDKSSSHRGCRPRKPTDLAFVIDSKRDDNGQLWNLTRDILSKLDLDDDRLRVRFFQECGPGSGGLNLGEFDTKESLIDALDARINAPPTSTAQLIRNMANALSPNADGPPGRRRVGIYLTDGASDSIEDTLTAAQSAKHADGVEVFAVGVGHGTSLTELRAIASCDVARHYYAMNHHSKADAIAKKISKVICLGR